MFYQKGLVATDTHKLLCSFETNNAHMINCLIHTINTRFNYSIMILNRVLFYTLHDSNNTLLNIVFSK